MRIIRASEVNSFLYCQRSWQFRLKGVEPANRQELLSGTEMHYRHGRMVVGSTLLKILAGILIFAAIFLIALYFILPGG
jgi:hypothetical protein